MWDVDIELLSNGTTRRYTLRRDDKALSYRDVVALWRSDAKFCKFFNTLLAECPYTAFRWETPVVSVATMGRDFEFVAVDSPELARRVDTNTFAEKCQTFGTDSVATFPNLGGDAVLVVPCEISAPDAYGHLASFVRDAPSEQRQAFWGAVGEAMQVQWKLRPVWLSTAGMGVAWVHVRLDSRPKYYAHASYRNEGSPGTRYS
ncbi:hypothetical protein Pan258_10420 [Symmachiella dynata]|uniref:DUF6940 family protein n=1 Tax=Symmachiella dynata TaxID=2527995 RepID=UPI00118BA691|nr:hypothetical protein [Symmachiella dynata]QDT47015.1 hypothetical protein Pan258_10420 [Symmachiella dynata]